MERQLQELLKIRDNLIPELVEAYNVDTREFNALEEEHEKLTQERDELWATVLKQTKIIEQQKAKLDELTQTAETLAKASTSRINGLEAELVTVKSELTDFKRLNPKKLEKTNKEQKARLSTLNSKASRLEGELRNERRDNERLKNQLSEQKIGFWYQGQERVIPFLPTSVIQSKDVTTDSNVHIGAWWQHECGVKILCSYDEAEDDIYMCDPYDESGKVVEPSTTAQKVMLKHFRTLAKAKKR